MVNGGLAKTDIIYISPDGEEIPSRLVDIDKSRCTAIVQNNQLPEPWMMGTAYVTIKNIPNGLYSVSLIRISEPLSINSTLSLISKVDAVNINIDRSLLSTHVNAFQKKPIEITAEMKQENMSRISEEHTSLTLTSRKTKQIDHTDSI